MIIQFASLHGFQEHTNLFIEIDEFTFDGEYLRWISWCVTTRSKRRLLLLKSPNMRKVFISLFVLLYLTLSVSTVKYKDRCSTLSCVHSSATIIQKLNKKVDPCENFYDYACGTFLEEQHTPDEKTTVDTLALMSDKLTEYLLTLLLQKSEDDNHSKLHKLAKTLFNSCSHSSRS